MACEVDVVERARIRLAVDFVLLLAEEKADRLLCMPAGNMADLVSGLNGLMTVLVVDFPEMSPCSLVVAEVYRSLAEAEDPSVMARLMGWGIVKFCVVGLGYSGAEFRAALLKYK